MNEIHTTAVTATLLHRLASHAAARPSGIALRQKRNGIWHESTWKDYWRMVGECALGLKSIGVARGERVAILSTNRQEWLVVHLGTSLLGAVPVGLYASTTPTSLAQQLRATNPMAVVCEDQEQFDKVRAAQTPKGVPRSIVVLDMSGIAADAGVLSYDGIVRAGATCAQKDPSSTTALLDAMNSSPYTSVVLSSGSGGEHRAIEFPGSATETLLRGLLAVEHLDESDEVLSLLPLAHPTEQLFSLSMPIHVAATVNFPESRRGTLDDIREIAPTILVAPPRIWEGLHREMLVRRAATGPLRRRIFDWAQVTPQERATRRRAPWNFGNRLQASLQSAVAQRGLRNFLGLSHARLLGSVGAVASPGALEFFRGIGLPLRNLYSVAEIGGLVAIGDVELEGDMLGHLLPTLEHRVGPGGTLGICSTRTSGSQETQHALNVVESGDVVEVQRNTIRFLGRKADQIFGEHGGLHPSMVERSLKSKGFIREALVSPNARGQLQALVQIDPFVVGEWAKAQRIGFTTFASLATNPQVQDLIAGVLRELNQSLLPRQRVAAFTLLHRELDTSEDELTPLLALRRTTVLQRHASRLAAATVL